ncbi:MAG TPA: DoxX family protein [Ktedonobacteraceae bacterium]|nr:DoxX family protein [Ktedonobacteraceae bacterium]
MKLTLPSCSRRIATTLLWIITIFLVALFLVEAGGKLLLDAKTVQVFLKWGYPAWFVVIVGILEFTGALLFLIPRFALLGAALLVIDMIGAIVTGIIQGIWPIIAFSAIVLVLLVLIGWTRRKRFVGWSLLQTRLSSFATRNQRI